MEKMKFEIEVEVGEDTKIMPEEGKQESDYTKEELEKCRKEYAADMRTALRKYLKRFTDPDTLLDDFMETEGEELYVDGLDEWSDYAVKITAKEIKE